MQELIMMKGLPASGKSTFARNLTKQNPNMMRVNNDEIRAMLGDTHFPRSKEKLVTKIRENSIRDFLEKGYSVVVDNTNLCPSHEKNYKELAKEFNCDFKIEFFDIPLDECLRRNNERAKKVPDDVIIKMAKRYNVGQEKPEFEKLLNLSFIDAVVFDIDGTLAKMNGRSPYDYSKVLEDSVHQDIANFIPLFKDKNKIIIVSGRPDSCREDTEQWLKDNDIYYDELYMRKAGDTRKDSIIKYEIAKELVEKYYIKYIFDDRNQVVKMFREAGFRVLQVND